MVAIDGVHNDWRHLLLPLAQSDELVMNAVLAASAFHFHMNQQSYSGKVVGQGQQHALSLLPESMNPSIPNPNHLYARAIEGLRRQQGLICGDHFGRHSILLTILLLLTAAMVTGGPDFELLVRMFESAFDAMGGESGLGQGILAEFILREFDK